MLWTRLQSNEMWMKNSVKFLLADIFHTYLTLCITQCNDFWQQAYVFVTFLFMTEQPS